MSSCDSATASAALEGGRLVDGPAASLVAANQVLRVLRTGPDLAAAGLGVRGDLALDYARVPSRPCELQATLSPLLKSSPMATGYPMGPRRTRPRLGRVTRGAVLGAAPRPRRASDDEPGRKKPS